MKVYQSNTYTEIVRVEIKNLATKQMRSISFTDTDLEEVIAHVNKTLKVGIMGIKVRVNIRISDPVKKWGAQKNSTVYIEDLDKAIEQIKANIPTLDLKEVVTE